MSMGWNPLSGLNATRCTHVHSLTKRQDSQSQDSQSCTLHKAPFTLLADGGSLTCPSMVAAMRSMRYLLASRSAASRKILLRSSCGRFSHALRAFRLASIAFFSKSWQQQRNIMRQNTPPLCAQIQSACMYYLMLNTAIQYFHKIQGTGLLCLRSKSLCLCPSDQVSVCPSDHVCVHLTMCLCVHLTVCLCVHLCVCVHMTMCLCPLTMRLCQSDHVSMCPCPLTMRLRPSDHVSVSIWPCVYLNMCLHWHNTNNDMVNNVTTDMKVQVNGPFSKTNDTYQ